MAERDYDSDTCETTLSEDLYDEDCHEFIEACRDREWKKVREWLEDDPSRAWEYKSCSNMGVASYLAKYNNVELLRYVFELIEQDTTGEPERRRKLLREVFESGHEKSSVHIAAKYGHIPALVFLMEHHPNGADILELWSDNFISSLPIHLTKDRECFEFLLRHNTTGIEMLRQSDEDCDFPLQLLGDNTYFTPRKIRELGLERELNLVSDSQYFENNSLPSLVLDVIRQQTEVLLYRNKSISATDKEWSDVDKWLKEPWYFPSSQGLLLK